MAATDTRAIKNSGHRVYGRIRDWTTGWLLGGGLTLTAQQSIDGAAFSGTGVTATEVGTTGCFYVDIAAANFTGNHHKIRVTALEANAEDFTIDIIPEPACDSGVAQGAASGSITLRASASSVDSFYNGLEIEIVKGTGAGQIRIITTYTGSTKVATVDQNWGTTPDNTSTYKVYYRSPKQTSGGLADANLTHIASTGLNTYSANFFNAATYGTVVDASATTNEFDVTTTGGGGNFATSHNFYVGQMLCFTTGALAGVARRVTSYTVSGNVGTFGVYPALPSAPANGVYLMVTGYIPS